MLQTIEIVSILLVALAMAPALAHFLEFPGKSRLTKDAYLAVQPIYYPGFTIAGSIGEVGGLIFVRCQSGLGGRQFAITRCGGGHSRLGRCGMDYNYRK